MGTPDQAMHRRVVEVRGPSQRLAWALWIIVSVIGAVVAALVAWQVRTFFAAGMVFSGQSARYAATVVEALIFGGAQWLRLRRYRFVVGWGGPGSVVATPVQ